MPGPHSSIQLPVFLLATRGRSVVYALRDAICGVGLALLGRDSGLLRRANGSSSAACGADRCQVVCNCICVGHVVYSFTSSTLSNWLDRQSRDGGASRLVMLSLQFESLTFIGFQAILAERFQFVLGGLVARRCRLAERFLVAHQRLLSGHLADFHAILL